MYKTIVVGTDGSAHAQIAVDQAIALAAAFGSELHIVHAVHYRPRDPAAMDAAARALQESNRDFDEGDVVTADALANANALGANGQIHAPNGDPADVLIAIAEAQAADLLVVGNRGMSGLRRFTLGNVPGRIAHRCPCNLLIVETVGQGEDSTSGGQTTDR
jgi:nucleotide-binding universal stress UspA family protein